MSESKAPFSRFDSSISMDRNHRVRVSLPAQMTSQERTDHLDGD